MDYVGHFEIPAKDLERSKKFYANVFSWHAHDILEMSYTMLHTVETDKDNMPQKMGAINGGMISEEDNGGTNPVLVITVPSIDDYVKKIEEAGGKMVMPKTEVGDMGFYARFTDTEGVVMGIWEDRKK